MENHSHQDNASPPDCFRLEELEQMQSFEKQVLAQVNYYCWIDQAEADALPYRFLFFLELVFEDLRSLLLTYVPSLKFQQADVVS